MKIRKLFLIMIIMMLAFPSAIANATNGNGMVESKEEVVYATLSAEGLLKDIYVVNILDVTEPGQITDHGDYTNIKNLTNLEPIRQENRTITVEADDEGEFYYQGNMNDQALPWEVQIDYRLDGKKISPNQLAGKTGHLEIKMNTSKNEAVNQTFFDNYLLQISVTAGSDVFKHIQTEEGSIANAGEDLTITWTAMPEKSGAFTLEADVMHFEMKGFEIAALPSSMPIESPDTEALTNDFKSLSDAIKELNNGVGELSNGLSELDNGASQLANGSASFQNGLIKADNSSSSLIDASNTIGQSLRQMSQSVGGSAATPDLSQLETLQQGLEKMAKGLEQTAGELNKLNKNYTNGYQSLDQAMQPLPNAPNSKKEMQEKLQNMQAVVASFSDEDPNKKVAKEMMETYQAAMQAKETYDQVRTVFDAVNPALDQTSSSLQQMADNLSTTASELAKTLEAMDVGDSFAQLEQGLNKLASNYGDFHAGLLEYTDGMDQLTTSYSDVDQGIGELTNGTNELASGANKLHSGTEELKASTADLPDEIKNEIDAMLEQYDKSDYEPISFVSSENKNVERVQFVIRTESIESKQDEETTENIEQKQEQKSFWEKVLDLFR
ncbi:Chromosome partition protein Smc [Paraliobacillus sp. PM-2]|uniref:YhgE/Pip domain-containing protein n=1 Tax=Paraliobacillus sp. PM-2 TaxID=1462524 RepID=UPI00061C3CB5|nr:YhgE/Pip domain-containing protein [Paraliobacillus sp. PM-2]CQR46331.1 Chromosome partition protein Smc [Paraliobacillus sp. PM-2]